MRGQAAARADGRSSKVILLFLILPASLFAQFEVQTAFVPANNTTGDEKSFSPAPQRIETRFSGSGTTVMETMAPNHRQSIQVRAVEPAGALAASKSVHLRELEHNGATGRTLYGLSVATMISGNVADVASSWSRTEENPVLGRGERFGIGSVAIKSALVGGALVVQHIALRFHPEFQKRFTWVNFGLGGALGGVAAHNMR